ncbi:MAG: hypothetical protein KF851_07490 [Pirellulaceae bacterium]|jgi:hypothetical protein|nr:hypothetical protein [Pirellulaceae bacterium]
MSNSWNCRLRAVSFALKAVKAAHKAGRNVFASAVLIYLRLSQLSLFDGKLIEFVVPATHAFMVKGALKVILQRVVLSYRSGISDLALRC